MGSDIYLASRFHSEENFGPAMTAIAHALKALEDGDVEKAKAILKKAKKLEFRW